MNWQNIAQTLQQQIGQNAANYEGRIAVLTDQFQTELQAREEQITSLQQELEALKGANVSEETPTDDAD